MRLKRTYSSREVAALTGLTARQLQIWDSGGLLSPNEARKKYQGFGPVDGGDTPYLQQQNYGLSALAKRDANDPFAKPKPAPVVTPPPVDAQLPADQMAASLRDLLTKELEAAA